MFAVSEAQENAIVQRTAEIIAAAMMEAAGGVEELIVLPMATVCLITGLTRQTVPQYMRVTNGGGKGGKAGVTIAELRRYQKANTQEIQKPKKGRAVA
jgi:hypothetical protein